ncbi:MAG TPA: 3-phosphoserine/phosphohydroxythreonine transaminase [Acidimicrobiaceae bacterium]|jgi:phosphoserine aminotransferase|nr:3-phosphoserine/phosphohydroxythreonine transaminase [Acidimicrobiaceae bacterium]
MITSTRVHNFCAGPCTLPVPVLEEVRDEFLDFDGTGMSIIEASHRAAAYDAVHMEALADFRSLAAIPDDFTVLFIGGGASLQFAQVPMNLLAEGQTAGYLNTGAWGKKALGDAMKVASVYEAWSGADGSFMRMPTTDEIEVRSDARYLHVTTNETIGGIRLPELPAADIPLVSDMSSDFLSRGIDWDVHDLVYGGAQKNLGPAGLAIVVVRRDRLSTHGRNLASYLDYATHDANDSMANTPPMFAIYVMGKVLRWMKAEGGLGEFERRAAERASLVYGAIDGSDGWYTSPVDEASRSHMNIVFRLPDEDLEKRFVAEAGDAGMVNLKGHRSVGGIRASVYNAMPVASVEVLVDFMGSFRAANG